MLESWHVPPRQPGAVILAVYVTLVYHGMSNALFSKTLPPFINVKLWVRNLSHHDMRGLQLNKLIFLLTEGKNDSY